MLTKIKFKNFNSFIKDTIIDLNPTKSEILLHENVYNNVLKGCCFFGANASGKTNALNAITLLLDLLFGNLKNFNSLITLFNNEELMYFEYTFSIDEKEIVYYFEITRNGKISKETLFLEKKILLNRILLSCESNITDKKKYSIDEQNGNMLFLRIIYFNTGFQGNNELIHLFEFLKNSIYFNPSKEIAKIIAFTNENLKEIGLQNYLDKYGTDEINNFFNEYNFPYRISYEKSNLPDSVFTFGSRLKFIRNNLNDIPYFMESYGNIMLLNILPSILTIVKTGGILAIDEFSSGLHNQLEELLIKYINSHSTNCQLFFVSHSTNLLKTSLLRPDQVYSTDFDINGSFIKKFSDEKPRESQNLEKMYLSGVFGGIPLYGKNEN